jgi:DNA-binding MarR family transcriptional regulator
VVRPDEQVETLSRSVVALIFHLSRHLATTIDRRMSRFNVTGQQAALLLRTCAAPESSPSHLAPWLGTDNAGMTRLLDRLETKGLIVRRASAADRRAIVVEPTDAGRALAPELVVAFRAVTGQLLDGFTPEELPAVQALLNRLFDNVHTSEHDHGYV